MRRCLALYSAGRSQWAGALTARPFLLPCLKPSKDQPLSAVLDGLRKRVAMAPTFYLDSPVVVDLEDCPDMPASDLASLSAELRQLKLRPVGVTNAPAGLRASATAASLALLPPGGSSSSASASSPVSQPTVPATKVVVATVRAGQQIHSSSNLVLIGSVNPGGEVLADGDITIYGSLKGRALAGMALNNAFSGTAPKAAAPKPPRPVIEAYPTMGSRKTAPPPPPPPPPAATENKSVNIFVTEEFDAEMVAIGDMFLPLEEKVTKGRKGVVRVRLEDDRIVIETLGG